ncbi:MAG TPA: molybdate ABC transporter substrate-binding protein [Candidatus Polarisedimenticolia bacterium]|nr:molybdate ABC transporter substrate-binding protein [Candidatus Polarisedimenticolia bacterium]
MIRPAICFALVWALLGAGSQPAELSVSAATSLTEALREIGATYEPRTSERLAFNFSASSTLARQIEEGAPADLFFSADEAKMDVLEQKALLLPGTRRSLLSNTLVIVVRADGRIAIDSPADLAKESIRRIALAEPNSVPAGVYAREHLEAVGLWEKLREKVVPTENVRAALAAVESGDADAGMVYRTDARISRRVRIAYEVPPAEGPKISYSVAVLRESRRPDAARRFLAYLESEDALRIFRRHGFLIAGGRP